ncbi:MAG: hypothetical protein JWM53_3838 [bacterium]|nr:hypothetical protein [bacterium]
MRALAVALVLAAAGGCTKADLSDFAFVQGLRLLGAQAEPPEAAPGDTVNLTAWVVNTHGGAVDVQWSACTLPSNGVANPACTDGSGNGLVAIGSGEMLTFVVPAVDAATLGEPDVTGGVYLPIVIHMTSPDDTLDAIYRLRIAQGGDRRNNNPTLARIEGLRDDGVPEVAVKDVVWALIARYSGDSVEEYVTPASAPEPVAERLTTQWFATAGSFPDLPVGGTAVQSFKLDRALPPSGAAIDLWLVGHDERGGTTMIHRAFVMK